MSFLIRKTEAGHTLPELMIVLAIIAILVSIVYPTYSSYMMETRRSDAWVTLSAAAADQERWYTVNQTYTDELENLGGSSSPEKYYTLSVATTNSTFTLTATAKSDGAQTNDSGCTVITINHLGARSPANCW